MATLAGNTASEKNPLQACFDPRKLRVFRLKTTSTTPYEFRFIPEIRDGEVLPMVKSITPLGPDFSNLMVEYTATFIGRNSPENQPSAFTKFTGFCTPIEGATSDFTTPFVALYIRLKSYLGKKQHELEQLPVNLQLLIPKLLAQSSDRAAQVSKPPLMAFGQGIMVGENDQLIAQSVAAMSPSARDALNKFLTEQYEAGVDLFSPDTGKSIIFNPVKPDRNVKGQEFGGWDIQLGRDFPLTVAQCKTYWVPWEDACVKYTREELVQRMIAAFGPDLVSLVSDFAPDVARLTSGAPAAPAKQVQPAAPKPTTPATHAAKKPALGGAPVVSATSLPEDAEVGEAPAAPTKTASAPAPAAAAAKAVDPAVEDDMVSEFERMLNQDAG